jgi:hypothetical protein
MRTGKGKGQSISTWLPTFLGANMQKLFLLTGTLAMMMMFACPPPPTPLQVTTPSLPDVQTGNDYSAQLLAEGGVPPYTWSIIKGALPQNLVITPDGKISGNVLFADCGAGSCPFTFTVQVMDSSSTTAQVKAQGSTKTIR